MSIDLGLSGKVAIVTGSGGGIGREIALSLASEGVSVVVNDIGVSLSGEGGSLQPAEETCGLITQKGGKAIIEVVIDVDRLIWLGRIAARPNF